MASSSDHRVDQGESFLEGKLLIALPGMADERFTQTVIYMCAHSAKGAMGIVINKPIPGLSFVELMKQLQIETNPAIAEFPILYGGPVETGRGFVLHSGDYEGSDSTLPVSEDISLTATLDILRAIADGRGPETGAVRARLCRLGARARSKASSRAMAGCIARPIPRSCSACLPKRNGARRWNASASAHRVWYPTPDARLQMSRPGSANREIRDQFFPGLWTFDRFF